MNSTITKLTSTLASLAVLAGLALAPSVAEAAPPEVEVDSIQEYSPADNLAPSITTSPQSGAPGDSITISGTDFQPGEMVEVGFGGTTIATAQANSIGNFSASATIPDFMPEGTHPMDASGSMGSSAFVDFVVVAASPPPTSPPPDPSSGAVPAPGNGSAEEDLDNAETDFALLAEPQDQAALQPDGTGNADVIAAGVALATMALAAGAIALVIALRNKRAALTH